jgi:hypothetical protein
MPEGERWAGGGRGERVGAHAAHTQAVARARALGPAAAHVAPATNKKLCSQRGIKVSKRKKCKVVSPRADLRNINS